jgi:hypothetical protein
MLGFGEKHHSVDPTTLPIFVHALQSAEAFDLVQKVWENNSRYVMTDSSNRKELMRFAFSQPACVVSDTFELILLWDEKGDKQDVSEVYVISALAGMTVGDDSRVKNLLNAILTSPSIMPVNANKPAQ